METCAWAAAGVKIFACIGVPWTCLAEQSSQKYAGSWLVRGLDAALFAARHQMALLFTQRIQYAACKCAGCPGRAPRCAGSSLQAALVLLCSQHCIKHHLIYHAVDPTRYLQTHAQVALAVRKDALELARLQDASVQAAHFAVQGVEMAGQEAKHAMGVQAALLQVCGWGCA
eukprot:1161325-Pelagomonas_calceolata.AAC.8